MVHDHLLISLIKECDVFSVFFFFFFLPQTAPGFVADHELRCLRRGDSQPVHKQKAAVSQQIPIYRISRALIRLSVPKPPLHYSVGISTKRAVFGFALLLVTHCVQ